MRAFRLLALDLLTGKQVTHDLASLHSGFVTFVDFSAIFLTSKDSVAALPDIYSPSSAAVATPLGPSGQETTPVRYPSGRYLQFSH